MKNKPIAIDTNKKDHQEEIEEILKKLRNLILSYNNSSTNKASQTDISKYLTEISNLSSSLQKTSSTREYKLISNNNGVIIWGHPDDPANAEKQITYELNPDDKKYIISAGKKAHAYILQEAGKNTELVTIQNKTIFYAGDEKLFVSPKRARAIKLRTIANERFEDKLHKDNISVTKPFDLKDDQKAQFQELLKQSLSDNIEIANKAFEEIYNLAEQNNTYNSVVNALPYYDQENNLIFGFDDQREKRRFSDRLDGQQISSKYSVAYKITSDQNSSPKLEILTSTHTSKFYVMAMVNQGTASQKIECIEVGAKNTQLKFHKSVDTENTIINFDKGKNIECKDFCRIIRSGTSTMYGVGPYDKTEEFIDKISSSNLFNGLGEQKSKIIGILKQVLSFDDTNALLMTFSPKLLSEDSLKEVIIDCLSEIKKDTSSDIENIFRTKINIWKSQEIKQEETPESHVDRYLKETPKFPNNIRDIENYEKICSFYDKNCKDEDGNNYLGSVFLFAKKNSDFEFKKDLSDSFIIEIRKEPMEIRVRLGLKNEKNIVKAKIEYSGHILTIQDGTMLHDLESKFKDTIFDTYRCEGCISHYHPANQKKLTTAHNKTLERS